jgi:hypothetical protein
MSATPRSRGIAGIFLAPALIAACVAAGLVSALLGDGIWDAMSWIALLVPVGIIVRQLWRQRG